MMFSHNCDTCSSKGDCSLEKILRVCRESYTAGVASLAALVSISAAKEVTVENRFTWVVCGVETVGLSVERIDEFLTTLEPIYLAGEEEFRSLKVALAMNIAAAITTQSVNLINALAPVLGVPTIPNPVMAGPVLEPAPPEEPKKSTTMNPEPYKGTLH